MSGETAEHVAPTRRDAIKYGGAVVGGGLLAGCAGDEQTPSVTPSGEPGESSYTVELSPAGEVQFDSPPETVFTRLTHHAGMVVALGHGDSINALHAGGYYDVVWNKFLDRLDGVAVDWDDLYSATEFDKEALYDLDSDLHLVDPASVLAMDNWEKADLGDIEENVGPWFGNKYSGDHGRPPEPYAESYEYYGLWDIFARVAAVFREQRRYEALAEIHSEMRSTIEAKLPPRDERPSVALVLFSSSFESMWGYQLNSPGFYSAQTEPFGATGAYADAGVNVGDDAEIDAEALLEADPDVILSLGGMAEGKNMDRTREFLENDPVTGSVTAVEEGRVHPQGARWQGPLVNLFQIEMTAKQLYPEQFGEWPTYVDGSYPEIPEQERLFDRDRVAAIVNGDF